MSDCRRMQGPHTNYTQWALISFAKYYKFTSDVTAYMSIIYIL